MQFEAVGTLAVLEYGRPFSVIVYDEGTDSPSMPCPEWGPVGSHRGWGRTGGFANAKEPVIASEGLLMIAVEVLRLEQIGWSEISGEDDSSFHQALVEIKDLLTVGSHIFWRERPDRPDEIILPDIESPHFFRLPLSEEGAEFIAARIAGVIGIRFIDREFGGVVLTPGVRKRFADWGFRTSWTISPG